MERNNTYWSVSSAPRNRKVDDWVLRMLFVVGISLTLTFGAFWFAPEHRGTPWLFVVFTIVFWYSVLRVLFTWFIYAHVKKPESPDLTVGKSVAIFTTSYAGEPLGMVRKTLEACAKVRYPHTTYLLDNTGDPAFRETAEATGAVWLDMEGVQGAKAGKVNAAISRTDEEFILILDPDHIPFPEFFDHTLGYFNDPKVGFVQVSQGYYNQHRSFVATGAAEQTYMFYGPVQMAYSELGNAVAIGANCTFRRAALESIGGHVIGLAEDLQTSLRIHSAGWKSVYNPVIANRGLVPEDFDAFAKQQLKWARGAMEVLLDDLPKVLSRLTLTQKMIYASIASFYFEGAVSFFFIIFPFLFFLTGLVPVDMPVAHFMFFALLYLLVGAGNMFVASRFVCHSSERYFHWRAAVLKFACWPVYFYAFLLTIFREKIPYIPTAKTVGTNWPVFIRPHWAYLGLFAGGVTSSFVHRSQTIGVDSIYSSSVLWWCMVVFAGVTALMSIVSIWATRPPRHLTRAPDPWDELGGMGDP